MRAPRPRHSLTKQCFLLGYIRAPAPDAGTARAPGRGVGEGAALAIAGGAGAVGVRGRAGGKRLYSRGRRVLLAYWKVGLLAGDGKGVQFGKVPRQVHGDHALLLLRVGAGHHGYRHDGAAVHR